MTTEEINILIEGCRKKDRKSQKMLYQEFYAYAMSICVRYAGNQYEASEILNDGFFKIFTQIHKYDSTRPFKPWLTRIMCNTSIDYYRSNIKKQRTKDIEIAEPTVMEFTVEEKLAYEDLLALVQKLSPAFRTVFNLFAIDGYSHEEIAKSLNINTSTSRSNLFKARQILQQMLKEIKGPKGINEIKEAPVVPITMPLTNPLLHSNNTKL